jgi:hypothetical protein
MNRYNKEGKLLKDILNANAAQYLSEAPNVPERKRDMMKKLDDEEAISPKHSAEYLDLLGLILRGDKTKCWKTPEEEAVEAKAKKLYEQADALDDAGEEMKAGELFRQSAEMGYAEAQGWLGICYSEGFNGFPKDRAKAIEWYWKAAEQGEANSLAMLAYYYEEGKGVPQDLTKAEELYQRSLAAGNENVKGSLLELKKMRGAQE